MSFIKQVLMRNSMKKPFSLYGPTCSFLILDKLNEAGIFSPNNDFM